MEIEEDFIVDENDKTINRPQSLYISEEAFQELWEQYR